MKKGAGERKTKKICIRSTIRSNGPPAHGHAPPPKVRVAGTCWDKRGRYKYVCSRKSAFSQGKASRHQELGNTALLHILVCHSQAVFSPRGGACDNVVANHEESPPRNDWINISNLITTTVNTAAEAAEAAEAATTTTKRPWTQPTRNRGKARVLHLRGRHPTTAI